MRAEHESGKGAEQRPHMSWLNRMRTATEPAAVSPPQPARPTAPPAQPEVPGKPRRTAPGPRAPAAPAQTASQRPGPPSGYTPGAPRSPEWGGIATRLARWVEQRRATPKTPRPPWHKTKLAERTMEAAKERNLDGLLNILMEGLRLPAPIIVASVISSLLGLALPLAVLQIYDRILPNQSMETLTLLTLGLFGAFALDAILKVLRSYLLGWNAVRSGFDAQLTAVTRLLNAGHDRVEKEPPTTWVDGLEAVRELSAFEGGQSRLLTLDIPLASIFLIVLGLVGGPLVVVPVLLIVGFGAIAAVQGARLQKVLVNRSEQDNRKHDFLVESLDGIHTVKGLAMEPMILRRFERLQKGSALASYNTILLGNKLQSMGMLFANLMMISVVTVGALFVMAGHLSIGGLACCSLLSGRLTQPVLRGIGMWTEFQNIQLAQERAGKFAELSDSREARDVSAGDITGAIDFLDAGFTYPGNGHRVALSGISLQIRPGEFVGIKGEDGSGRSTLVKLITGELNPTSGKVVVHGLEAYPDRSHLHVADIAYVSAQTESFKGTILENITMFRSGPAIEAAQRAARLIGLEDEIHRLPDGYDTPLAQGVAQTLSSGLLQRIAIARALARNPRILIFDEANTLLDFQSDLALRRGLESLKGKMTAIIISNRPSFLAVADRVYALNGGSLEPWQQEPPRPIEQAGQPAARRAAQDAAAPAQEQAHGSTQVPMQGSAA